MNGSEKQTKLATQIINDAISELNGLVAKYETKLSNKPNSKTNNRLLREYKFHADIINKNLINLSDAASIIDNRSIIEKTKLCTRNSTYNFLHYVVGISEKNLPEIPDNF